VLPTEHLLAFVLIAAMLILVPGPSVLFVVTRSLTLGPRAGLATVAGNAAGVYAQVVAVAFGIGALVQESIHVFTAIKLAGAAYLVYLGVQTFRHRRSLGAALDAPVERRLLRRTLADAFVVGVFNPKVVVFFVAILPQFVDRWRRSARPAASC
jgi:threonine/homoserine/homoserine lactone efflux protein